MRRVLVPTDFSEAALLVSREPVFWLATMGGEVLLLHVVPDICLAWLDHPDASPQTHVVARGSSWQRDKHRAAPSLRACARLGGP
jgi:nucleotide-binding universal stress UspA family protein